MDPQATWKRFLEACAERDTEEAMYALMDLRVWIASGGKVRFIQTEPTEITYETVVSLIAMLKSSVVAEHTGS